MKIKWFGRNIEVTKKRLSIHGFKNEKYLIGMSYRWKDVFTRNGIKTVFWYLFLNYDRLNDMFISGKI